MPAAYTFSDFGLPADIAAPAPADVIYDDDPTILTETFLS